MKTESNAEFLNRRIRPLPIALAHYMAQTKPHERARSVRAQALALSLPSRIRYFAELTRVKNGGAFEAW